MQVALEVKAPLSESTASKQMKKPPPSASWTLVFRRWFNLCALWFTGAERWQARGFALVVISLSFMNTLFMVKISYAQRNFSTALSGKDEPGFYRAVWDFVVIICIAAPLFTLNTFLEDRLVLSWRAYLTRTLLDAYFDNRAYFHLRQQLSYGKDGSLGSGSDALDNPDQRICDDVGAFCRSSTSISLALIKKVMNCTAFASVLWSISPMLVVFLFAYALMGTVATTGLFGRILTTLYFQLLAREGDLRFSLVRVREHAESIAFYRGDAQEHSVVSRRFDLVLATAMQRIKWTALYDLWTSIYNYATILAPSLLVGPRYFRGEVEFGVISQASFAFSSIDSALSVIINNLAQLSGLAAETDRLDALRTALMLSSSQQLGSLSRGIQRRRTSPSECVRLDRLNVEVPGSHAVMWRDLSLVLVPGQSLLVVGPSGCGKSSLLRALAGLWSDGSGSVQLPPASASFFLPQKPFMPLGTLRQQLLFPSSSGTTATAPPAPSSTGDAASPSPNGKATSYSKHVATSAPTTASVIAMSASGRVSRRHPHQSHGAEMDDADGTSDVTPLLSHQEPLGDQELGMRTGSNGDGGRQRGGSAAGAAEAGPGPGSTPVAVSDEELRTLLKDACLPDLLERVGDFDTELDWSHVLSSGEQQRVAFLRLLLHRPQVAFLDEATSAVDAATEAKLYQLLAQRVPCFVSVGHRMQLVNYHTHVLEHHGPGSSWTLHAAQDYLTTLNSA